MTFNEKGERLYTTSEAGEILGIRSRSVVELIRLGRITSAKRVGRMHYIAESEVKRYQRERQAPGFSWRQSNAPNVQSADAAQDSPLSDSSPTEHTNE